MNVYMIVPNDKFRLPLYWGDSIAELAKHAHMTYEAVERGIRRAMYGKRQHSKYEVGARRERHSKDSSHAKAWRS